jgi:hypothetical protein
MVIVTRISLHIQYIHSGSENKRRILKRQNDTQEGRVNKQNESRKGIENRQSDSPIGRVNRQDRPNGSVNNEKAETKGRIKRQNYIP